MHVQQVFKVGLDSRDTHHGGHWGSESMRLLLMKHTTIASEVYACSLDANTEGLCRLLCSSAAEIKAWAFRRKMMSTAAQHTSSRLERNKFEQMPSRAPEPHKSDFTVVCMEQTLPVRQ